MEPFKITHVASYEDAFQVFAHPSCKARTIYAEVPFVKAGLLVSDGRITLEGNTYLDFRAEKRRTIYADHEEAYWHLSLYQQTGEIGLIMGLDGTAYLIPGHDTGHNRLLFGPTLQGNPRKIAAWEANPIERDAHLLPFFMDADWRHANRFSHLFLDIMKDGGRHTYHVNGSGETFGFNRGTIIVGDDGLIRQQIEKLMNGVPEEHRRMICAVTPHMRRHLMRNHAVNSHVLELMGAALDFVEDVKIKV